MKDFDAPSQKLKLGAAAGVIGIHALTALGLMMVKAPEPMAKVPEPPPIEIQLISLPPPKPVVKTEQQVEPPVPKQDVVEPEPAKAAAEPVLDKIVEEEVLPAPTPDPIEPPPEPVVDETPVAKEPPIEEQFDPKPEPEITEKPIIKEKVEAVEDQNIHEQDWFVEQQRLEEAQRQRNQDAAEAERQEKLQQKEAIRQQEAEQEQLRQDELRRQEALQQEALKKQDEARKQEETKRAAEKAAADKARAEADARAKADADARAKAEADAKAKAEADAAKKAAEAATNTPVNFTATNANWASMPKFSFPGRASRGTKSGDTFEVVLLLRVNKQGGIDSVQLAKSSGNAILDREAQRQVRSGRFTPFKKDGVPVVGNVTLPISYQVP